MLMWPPWSGLECRERRELSEEGSLYGDRKAKQQSYGACLVIFALYGALIWL